MLNISLSAELPLIAVSTRDTVNASSVIARLAAPRKVSAVTPKDLDNFEKDRVYTILMKPKDPDLNYESLYLKLAKVGASLVIINPPKVYATMFDAGELETPKDMIEKFLMMGLSEGPEGAATAKKMIASLGNCTLKDTSELLRLTMARDHSFTPEGLLRSRKEFFQQQQGLTQVLGDTTFYDPPGYLVEWLGKESHFFLNETDHRLIPRGLLFDGPPGTGKTAGAGYIARSLGIPLFRFDVASSKVKWVGESERVMRENLQRLDREEPCVVLIDEVEKIFASSRGEGDGNTTTSMLSQLLWWLAEHRSRVLTLMTTNAIGKLPPELYRERRIDQVMTFRGLEVGSDETRGFVARLMNTFGIKEPEKAKAKENYHAAIEGIIRDASDPEQTYVSQSRITEGTFSWIKSSKLAGLKTSDALEAA